MPLPFGCLRDEVQEEWNFPLPLNPSSIPFFLYLGADFNGKGGFADEG